MSEKIIGRRYAEAIFSVAESKNKVKEIYDALNKTMELYLTNTDLKNILDNPLILVEEKEKVIEKIFIDENEEIKNNFINNIDEIIEIKLINIKIKCKLIITIHKYIIQ
ncbi:MAG: F0F1 ATP synthase subunit delta [Fusobacterium sp.]